jgi:ribose transport system substrate-binding protein
MATRGRVDRRLFLAGLATCGFGPAWAETRRYRIALAVLDKTPGVTLEGLGFTGAQLQRGFELASRTLPIDMLYYDNAGDPVRAIANAEAAISAKIDLLIEYNADGEANAEIARKLSAADIPALALVYPLPDAPLYGPDNRTAGRIAGRALGKFAVENWPGDRVCSLIIGDVAGPDPAVGERMQGIVDGIHETLPTLELALVDTGGQPMRADALVTKILQVQRGQRILIATLDDLRGLCEKRHRDEPAAK